MTARERYVVPVAFVHIRGDEKALVDDLKAAGHVVVGAREATREELEDDPRFAEHNEEIQDARARVRAETGPRITVLDIVYDSEIDDWYDAQLVGETEVLLAFCCCPGAS